MRCWFACSGRKRLSHRSGTRDKKMAPSGIMSKPTDKAAGYPVCTWKQLNKVLNRSAPQFVCLSLTSTHDNRSFVQTGIKKAAAATAAFRLACQQIRLSAGLQPCHTATLQTCHYANPPFRIPNSELRIRCYPSRNFSKFALLMR